MTRIDIEIAQEGKEAVEPVDTGNISTQEIDHPAPVVLRNPGAIIEPDHCRRMNPVAIMEMMIVQPVVAAETPRIPYQSSPGVIVVEQSGAFAIGIEPALHLALETTEQTVECILIARLGEWKHLGDSIKLFAQEIGISGREVI